MHRGWDRSTGGGVMGHYTIRHTFDGDPSAYWEAFFDPATLERLHRERWSATSFEIVEQSGTLAGGDIRRTLRADQPIAAPGPVKKVLGDTIPYTEVGTFDGTEWRYEVTPDRMGDKLGTSGVVHLERGGDGFDRVISVTTRAKLFGVGPLIDKFAESQNRALEDRSAEFFRELLASQ